MHFRLRAAGAGEESGGGDNTRAGHPKGLEGRVHERGAPRAGPAGRPALRPRPVKKGRPRRQEAVRGYQADTRQ